MEKEKLGPYLPRTIAYIGAEEPWQQVRGRRCLKDVAGLENVEFFLHRSVELWLVAYWQVSEASTGRRVGLPGRTQKEAIEFARGALERRGAETTLRLIAQTEKVP